MEGVDAGRRGEHLGGARVGVARRPRCGSRGRREPCVRAGAARPGSLPVGRAPERARRGARARRSAAAARARAAARAPASSSRTGRCRARADRDSLCTARRCCALARRALVRLEQPHLCALFGARDRRVMPGEPASDDRDLATCGAVASIGAHGGASRGSGVDRAEAHLLTLRARYAATGLDYSSSGDDSTGPVPVTVPAPGRAARSCCSSCSVTASCHCTSRSSARCASRSAPAACRRRAHALDAQARRRRSASRAASSPRPMASSRPRAI